jgi:hypothetical protein
LSKYPNADQLLLWRSYIYIACSLRQSSSQWNDDQKFEKLMELIKLNNKPPPTEAAQKAELQSTLTGQSHGFTVPGALRPFGDASCLHGDNRK